MLLSLRLLHKHLETKQVGLGLVLPDDLSRATFTEGLPKFQVPNALFTCLSCPRLTDFT